MSNNKFYFLALAAGVVTGLVLAGAASNTGIYSVPGVGPLAVSLYNIGNPNG